MLRIGFYLREINFRGIANSVYVYAKNNKLILKNKSIIFYNNKSVDNDKKAITAFKKEFKLIGINKIQKLEKKCENYKIDYCYFQRSGPKDYLLKNTKNIVHAVFPDKTRYHGDRFAYISEWLSINCSNKKYPFVPYPIKLFKTNQNLRNNLKIPKNSKVFGYHGGSSSFDLKFVKDVIKKISLVNNNIYFLFMNVNKFTNNNKIIFLSGTFDQKKKAKFINTCDAMIHARSVGESFGSSCAEFAIKNKPILTYGFCRQRAHYKICDDYIIPYYSFNDLMNKIKNFNIEKKYPHSDISKIFSEENTIKIFKKIFLSRKNFRNSINLNDRFYIFLFYLKKNYFYIRHKIYTIFYKIISK